MYTLLFVFLASIIGGLLGFSLGWVGLIIAVPIAMVLGFTGGILDAQRRI